MAQFFREQLHLWEGAGFDAAFIDSLRQREGFDFAHGDHDAVAALYGGAVVDEDVGDGAPARVSFGHGVIPLWVMMWGV